VRRLWVLVAAALIPSVAYSDDLYRVQVSGKMETEVLRSTGVDPVVRLADGYLVLADGISAQLLLTSGLAYRLVASNVEKDELAIDRRSDRVNIDKYPLVFEEGRLRIFRIDNEILSRPGVEQDLIGAERIGAEIVYRPPAAMDISRLPELVDLDSLVSLVSQDSVQMYTETLASYYSRFAGTSPNRDARYWLRDKFASFGYDSVATDTFVAEWWGTNIWCHNVWAHKTGTRFPGLQILVGAHFDGVYDSPGADDNASGVAAVLEMARALKDIETDMSFIFILFDAEELGLWGSEYYAERAFERDDSIMLMVNMDCIGYYDCNSVAYVEYGYDSTFAVTYRSLADSLTDLDILMSSGAGGGSDQAPFYQRGYEVLFSHEYVEGTWYSPHINTSHDSLCYVDCSYTKEIARASLATSYLVSQTVRPPERLAFDFPKGIPSMLSPGYLTTIDVNISVGWEGEFLPGSGFLHYALDDASYDSIAMTEVEPGYLQAVLPAADCGSNCTFYFTAEEVITGTYSSRDSAYPYFAVVSTGKVILFEDDFEADKGWTVYGDATDGHWERGTPVTPADTCVPPSDYDGTGMCYLTGAADGSDVDNGGTYLVSPPITLSGDDALVEYARWFGQTAYVPHDPFRVYVSNDGGENWSLVEEDTGDIIWEKRLGRWLEGSFWVGDFVTPTGDIFVRFEARDTLSGGTVEAAVDAFSIAIYECNLGVVDLDEDGVPITADNCPDTYNPQQEDADGDLIGDVCDNCTDSDGDGLGNPGFALNTCPDDNCPEAANADQADADGDGVGDVCDECTDIDGDGYGDPGYAANTCQLDNCPGLANPDQHDTNGDGIGDACCCGGIRGNANGAAPDRVNISDIAYLVDYLFGIPLGPPPPCPSEGNANGDPDEKTNVSDITYLISYLFGIPAGPPPPDCP